MNVATTYQTALQSENGSKTDAPDKPSEAPRVLNLYSEMELLRTITDFTTEVILSSDYEEDFRYTNLRIGLTCLACLVALYATALVPFPEGRLQLACLVGIFFSLLLVLFLVESFIVKSAIICVKDKFRGRRMFVDADLRRVQAQLLLTARQGSSIVTREAYIGSLFDRKGYLVSSVLREHVQRLLLDYESLSTRKTD